MIYDGGPYGPNSGAKAGPGGMTPPNASEIQWSYVEPLITPQQVKDRFLFGIPLVSNIKDPITQRQQVFTPELIQDVIERMVAMVEADTSIDIFPRLNQEKREFDQNHYLSFGFVRTMRRPAAALHKLSVSPSTNTDVFIVPQEWCETGRMYQGQINILPLTACLGSGGFVPATSAGGAVFLQILGNRPWLPSFWLIEYTSGFPDGLVPKLINEILGTYSAIEVLSMLAATYARTTSQSLGMDSLSQSTSGPGPALYDNRIAVLVAKRDQLKHKLKSIYGMTLFSGEV